MSLVVPFEEIFNGEGLLSKAEHWNRFELKSACTIQNGFALKSKLFNSEHGFPIIRIRDLKFNKVQTYYTGDYPQQYEVDNGDLLIGMDGDFICYEWGGGKAVLNQRVCKIVPNESILLKRFLFYGINGYLHAIQKATSSVTVGHLSSIDLGNIPFPIPPIDEQKIMVAKLDAIMQKVEANKHRLEKIPKLLKRFRQSVMAAAVSGRLTEVWREENNKVTLYSTNNINENYEWRTFDLPNTWKWDYIKNIGDHILGKMLDAAKNKGELTYYLRNVSVRWFEIDLDSLTEIKATKEDKIKFDLRDGDLFVCEGGEPGRAAVWHKGVNNFIFQKAIHRIRPNKYVNPYWVLYNLKVDADGGNLESLFTGTGIKHLTLKSLSKYPIAIPPIEEQKEIVRRIEQLFAFSDKIEARYTKAKAMLDRLPQSILAKAFRGELVPQDPGDEGARVLVERIKAEMVEKAEGQKMKGHRTKR
ncbi:MAG: restriction endonuclease subunit S [Saprospiraceae bacterium]|uniref:Restriction endonuclease subunit S n=1 Tax=Candidatus Opimibacter skivensis TaxID=2982028 RepID=A0A9D7XSL3_9BACT|nr:restriction endonuclease subunit S [Candidatus Opimibacter skivensis]